MPTYQYSCEKCGHEFEIFQSMTDKPLSKCPQAQCAQKRWGKGKVKRMIGAGAGLIFKGSGFYITDYRSDSYKQAAKKETASPAATSSNSSSKASAGDSKPAPAKTEAKSSPAKTNAK